MDKITSIISDEAKAELEQAKRDIEQINSTSERLIRLKCIEAASRLHDNLGSYSPDETIRIAETFRDWVNGK